MITLEPVCVNGVWYNLYPIDYETPDGTFTVYIHAVSAEHAAAKLFDLKETGHLRDGGGCLLSTTRIV